MELGSSFLFLQEQIKDIIIIIDGDGHADDDYQDQGQYVVQGS
jgi:hypothetical protein